MHSGTKEKNTAGIIGASGLVGSALYGAFLKNWNVEGTYYGLKSPRLSYVDIQDNRAVQNFFLSKKPDIVLIPAANPNVDYCEQHPEETRKVNVEGVMRIIDKAKKRGVKPVFFSTDYVFDGENGPYEENDEPNPINEYGRQKRAVEEYIKNNLNNYLIIRITVVYGWEQRGKNFVIRLIRALSRGEVVPVPNDQIGTPTYVKTISSGTKELVEKGANGVFHVAGTSSMSRADFARNVARTWGYDEKRIYPVATNTSEQPAKRPLLAGLSIKKAQSVLERTLFLSPAEGLLKMKEDIESKQ